MRNGKGQENKHHDKSGESGKKENGRKISIKRFFWTGENVSWSLLRRNASPVCREISAGVRTKRRKQLDNNDSS